MSTAEYFSSPEQLKQLSDIKMDDFPHLAKLLGTTEQNTDDYEKIVGNIKRAYTTEELREIEKKYKREFVVWYCKKFNLSPPDQKLNDGKLNKLFIKCHRMLEYRQEHRRNLDKKITDSIASTETDEWTRTIQIEEHISSPKYNENIFAEFEEIIKEKYFPELLSPPSVDPEIFNENINDVYDGMRNLIGVIREQKPDILVFLDKSARPFSWLLRDMWVKLFPSEPLPQIKYLNVGEEKQHRPQEANQYSLPDNQNILVIDDISSSGGSMVVAEQLVKQTSKGSSVQSTAIMLEDKVKNPRSFPLASRYNLSPLFDPGIGVYDVDDFGKFNFKRNSDGSWSYLTDDSLTAIAPSRIRIANQGRGLSHQDHQELENLIAAQRQANTLLRSEIKKLAEHFAKNYYPIINPSLLKPDIYMETKGEIIKDNGNP